VRSSHISRWWLIFSKKKIPFARYTSNVDAHGVIVLKLSNSTLISPPSFTVYNAAAPENTLAGGASVRVISSSISVVGFIGNGGTLTFNNIDGGESGTKLVPWITSTPISSSRILYAPTVVTHSSASMEVIQFKFKCLYRVK